MSTCRFDRRTLLKGTGAALLTAGSGALLRTQPIRAADPSAAPSPAPIPGSRVPIETIRRAPKVLLHDHLDGGLRPQTVIELADETGYGGLPTEDPDALAAWFLAGADRKSLELYLEGFDQTVAVMQTPDAIARVAAECVEDLAADGIVYAEVRYAPEHSTAQGLSMDAVMEAWLAGFATGMARAADAGTPIVVRALVTAMRQTDRSREVAAVALRFRDTGVVGFDLAGPEAGFPAIDHAPAFQAIRDASFRATCHAGEAAGLFSISDALGACSADRIGHGVRLADDLFDEGGETRLGRVARDVLDRRIPLEICPSSNVHTGAVPSIPEHPVERFRRLGIAVTVNTDNRLMSGVTVSSEMATLSATFGIGLEEMRAMTIAAIDGSFAPYEERMRILHEVVEPGYDRLIAEGAA